MRELPFTSVRARNCEVLRGQPRNLNGSFLQTHFQQSWMLRRLKRRSRFVEVDSGIPRTSKCWLHSSDSFQFMGNCLVRLFVTSPRLSQQVLTNGALAPLPKLSRWWDMSRLEGQGLAPE